MQATTKEIVNNFRDLNLTEMTLAALDRAGYHEPSPVQAHLIPPALEGRDCLGNAPTGTGKTAAFLIPLIERIDDRNRQPQAIVLAPTRELVHQIGREFERLSMGRRCRAVPVVGGESIHRQLNMLRHGAQLILATPGRMIDLMNRGSIRFDQVKQVVLDEADQMLDIGFRPDVERIMDSVPAPRQTLLLSATMPKSLRDLARRYLVDPADVRLIPENEDATIPAIRQHYLMAHHEHKFDMLVELLRREQPVRAVVFCRTKHGSDRIGNLLRNGGFRAEAMHGDLSQNQRNRVLHAFRQGRLNTLVATDVVGRGIDVPEISHVINFDVPEDPEHYVHRIGRTGRMGKDGAAFTFVLPDQGKLLDQIEKAISRELDAHQIEGIPSPPRPLAPPPFRRGGPARGRRPFRGNRPGGPSRGGGGGGGGKPLRRRYGKPQRVG